MSVHLGDFQSYAVCSYTTLNKNQTKISNGKISGNSLKINWNDPKMRELSLQRKIKKHFEVNKDETSIFKITGCS